MKVVIPGGSGHMGRLVTDHFTDQGHEVVVLGRSLVAAEPRRGVRHVGWDGENLGSWADEIDGSDVVLNLAGRSVNCRYNKGNLTEMLLSRTRSTAAVGAAIQRAANPPKVWLQASTATIYAHSFERANGEDGTLGGHEPDTPDYWAYSVEIAKAWERAQTDCDTPSTRQVALRTAILLAPGRGGAYDLLARLARFGLGGSLGGGAQYFSWIHGDDFCAALDHLIAAEHLAGPVNLAAPEPLRQREFARVLRRSLRRPVGFPATRWMVSIGTLALRTDPELVLKSRRVVPDRLLADGFEFRFPTWATAAADLARR